ncbi:MAG: amino acid ABC transporter permease [Anaerolineales bacterium]|nr:amino acid ABC transporter permease [Desulfobacteraceae bacterium]MCK4962899.1 amino acid ABC transporter permease [Anaerolineales bacterium]
MGVTTEVKRKRPGLIPWGGDLSRLPWWVLVVLLVFTAGVYAILTNRHWEAAFEFALTGVQLTLILSLSSFGIALVVGLLAGLGQLSRNIVFRNLSMLYVQVIRGIPIIVQLYFVAFVIMPVVVDAINNFGGTLQAIEPLTNFGISLANLELRDIKMMYRAIGGLAVAYGAFEAEVFRAGIESIERGQMEAARSLGMSYIQAMRHIILPQAIRVVLPPLGNDFISMLKDSSLAMVLAVRELTQVSQLHRARTFRSWESMGTAALLYLMLTLSLSFLVKSMERRMAVEK